MAVTTRTSPLWAGFAGAFVYPVAEASGPGTVNLPALDEARLLVGADPDSAAALLSRLIFESDADADTLAVLHLEAGRADWRRGDPSGALSHLEVAAIASDPAVAHRARLGRLCAWIELGLPDVDRARREVESLQGGPLVIEAQLVLVVVQARLQATHACRRSVADLDAEPLPPGLAFVHLVNKGVVLLEANDAVGALECFDAAAEAQRSTSDHALAPAGDLALDPWAPAILTMNRGVTHGVQAWRAEADVDRAALFQRALVLLAEARAALARLRAPDRLLGDCRRNLGVVHLWRGARTGDTDALEAALRNHWAALEHYRRRPELHRQVGAQWRSLGLCYRARADASADAGGHVRAQACFDRAERLLLATGDARALAELDLAEAALRLDDEPDAALELAVPAALFLDAQRFRLAGAAARARWSDGTGEDALDAALAAASQAGRGDLAAALVVWRRLGGAAQFEREGPLPVAGHDASVLTPPPRIPGVSEALAPYLDAAVRRYRVPESDLVGPTTIDLLNAPSGR